MFDLSSIPSLARHAKNLPDNTWNTAESHTSPSFLAALKQAFSVVRISAVSYVPFSNCSTNELPGRPGAYGCSMAEPRLLHSFLEHYNLTYSYMKPMVFYGDYGKELPNGSWTGHIGTILRGEADIAIGGITQTWARDHVTPFSLEVLPDAYSFAIHTPKRVPEYLNIYRPFNQIMWILTVLSVILCALSAAFLEKYGNKEDGTRAGAADDDDDDKDKDKGQSEPSGRLKLGKYAFETTALLLGQDVQSLAAGQSKWRSASMIVYDFFWQNAAGILAKAYSAAILAILVTPSFFPTPRDMNEAIRGTRGRIVYSPYDFTLEPTLRSIGNPDYRKAVDEGRFRKCQTYDCREWDFTGEEFLIVGSKVFAPDYLVLVDPATGMSPTLSKDTWLRSSLGWPMAHKSLLKPALDPLIRRATEMGIVNKVFDDEMIKQKDPSLRVRLRASWDGMQQTTPSAASAGGTGSDHDVLHLSHFSGAFMVWGGGLVAGLMAFTVELIARKKKARDEKSLPRVAIRNLRRQLQRARHN